jgi:hypothetical protein
MKVLFCAQHFTYFRNYESVVRLLAERGHQVHLVAEESEELGGQALVERLAAEHPQITWGFAPDLAQERWANLAGKIRHGLEYVRFLDPAYDRRPKYRHRAQVWSPRVLRALFRCPGSRRSPVRRAVGNALVRCEELLPASDALDAFLTDQAPDVLLLASVTNPGSPQMDYLKAARRLGIPVAMCVFSWDHLSGKSWIRIAPDRVFVWNDTQRLEAIEQHGLPAERVEVTGAQCWDQWFVRRPSRSYDAFCREMGLDPSQPFVLYACSVLSRPAPNEAQFVVEWIRRIRAAGDPLLRQAGILVRPHPERMHEWDGVDLGKFENVAFRGRNPVDPAAKDDYFDALHHCAAMVGIVTSAFIEAAIVGREVLTLELPEFSLHQRGAPHFNYLVEVAGGLLRVSHTYDEHLAQLAGAVAHASDGLAGSQSRSRSAQNARFLEAFVRPRGLEVPATPVFVEAVERLAEAGPSEARARGSEERPLRESWQAALVHRLARASSAGGIVEWMLMDVRDAESAVIEEAKARGKREAAAERDARERELQRIRARAIREKEEGKRRKQRRRVARERQHRLVQFGRRLAGIVGVGSRQDLRP